MIITNHHQGITYQTAQGITAPHAFTTRLGGVSTGHLKSLNIGTSRGDEPENVLENYRRLGNLLGFDVHNLVLSRQTHSDTVRIITDAQRGAGLFTPHLDSCDGLITNTPGITLVVFTADCTPILLHDPVTGAVGAVHAGWRGTASGIAGKAAQAMRDAFGCDVKNIRAAIGPNIGPCHFETDADVPDAMRAAYGDAVEPYIFPKGNKFYLDLKKINAMILRRAGVEHIEISDECTMCSPDRYWSHRITGQLRGSQGAVIVCKEASI